MTFQEAVDCGSHKEFFPFLGPTENYSRDRFLDGTKRLELNLRTRRSVRVPMS